MDGMSFDDLTRALAQKMPRRGALRLMGVALGALGSAKLIPTTAMANETPDFKVAFLERASKGEEVTAEGKKGRHRKKKKVRNFYAQCQADASALESECASFCYTNYGFDTNFFLACGAQCVSCVPYVQHCAYEEATHCVTAFDVVW
jgi:hypothetical protein